MPTSNGLSYSMNSFPRIACTMGAFSLPASSISSWVGLLKVSTTDFAARNLRGDRQNGNAAAMTVVEAVDQVQVPGTTTPGADRQPSREMCLRSGGKCCRLFMSHVNPSNSFLCSNRVRDAIERVAGNTVDLPNACFRENIDQQVRDFCLGHPHPSAQRQCMGHARCLPAAILSRDPRRRTHADPGRLLR